MTEWPWDAYHGHQRLQHILKGIPDWLIRATGSPLEALSTLYTLDTRVGAVAVPGVSICMANTRLCQASSRR